MTDTSALIDREIAALTEFENLLATEEAAMLARDAAGLTAASAAKLELIESLKSMETERRALPEDTEARGKLTQLKSLAQRCREKNAANEALVRAQRHYIEGLLGLMRGGPAAGSTYSAEGTRSAGDRRRLTLGTA